MLYLTIYLDGNTNGCGYKYVMVKDCTSWRACRNDNEFRYFLQFTGLKINPVHTKINDYRHIGKGRTITTAFYPHKVDDLYFWNIEEIPTNAKPIIDLCNGSYVNCYTVIDGDKTIIYKPNPNAKSVYIPYEYREVTERLKKGVFLNGYNNSVDNTFKYVNE